MGSKDEEEEEVGLGEVCLRCYDTHGLLLLAVPHGYVVSTDLIMHVHVFQKFLLGPLDGPDKSCGILLAFRAEITVRGYAPAWFG